MSQQTPRHLAPQLQMFQQICLLAQKQVFTHSATEMQTVLCLHPFSQRMLNPTAKQDDKEETECLRADITLLST